MLAETPSRRAIGRTPSPSALAKITLALRAKPCASVGARNHASSIARFRFRHLQSGRHAGQFSISRPLLLLPRHDTRGKAVAAEAEGENPFKELMKSTQPHYLQRPLEGQDGKLDHPKTKGSEEGPRVEITTIGVDVAKASRGARRRRQGRVTFRKRLFASTC